ncbi:hypothetical protein IKF30_00515, partial [Candidatus Saccharibacteria bacterium]|nr:hypothetical protein [Candidatus Saccharibacteria bacterium]
GAVIANKLILNRTYGAASGENSNIPAEIIDFDPSLYLWGGSSAGSEDEEDNVEIQSVYVRELAPRY